VLQPGTTESLGSNYNHLIAACKRISDSVRVKSPCAQFYIYQIPYGVPSQNPYPMFHAVQAAYKNNSQKMADTLKCQVAPAGMCFDNYYTAKPDLLLHPSYDEIHPNLTGSYLVACSMFASIYQEKSAGSSYYGNVPEATAKAMQGIADQVVLDNKSQWRINTHNLFADFEVSDLGNLRYKFTNKSSNQTTNLWEFDGQTSNLVSPEVQLNGSLQSLKLTATAGHCSKSKIQNFAALGLSAQSSQTKLKIYPNPSQHIVFVAFGDAQKHSLRLWDMTGHLLIEQLSLESKTSLDIAHLSAGNYLLDIDGQSYPIIKN
jgi:Secretion system C-terminal sorting domain